MQLDQVMSVPQKHRTDLEQWLLDSKQYVKGLTLDIGAGDLIRSWFKEHCTYKTVDESNWSGQIDYVMPSDDLDFFSDSVDTILCTDMLEHVKEPQRCVDEMRRVLKSGSYLLITAPFLWVWHGGEHYKDYWRFTEDGWRLLLKDFDIVLLKAADMAELPRFLTWGATEWMWYQYDQVKATTAYFIIAKKR